MSCTPLKAIALVVFLGAVAGATYGVQTIVGDSFTSALVAAEPVHGTLNATGGHDVSVALTIRNRGAEAQEMRAVVSGGAGSGQSDLVTVPADGARTVFVPITVSPDAGEGQHRLAVRLEDASGAPLRERAGGVDLVVLTPGEGLQEGQAARLVYTLRDGERVVLTNDPALEGLRAREFATLTAPERIDGAFPLGGLLEGARGMRPGESRRLALDADQTFPASDESTLETPRTDEIELVTEIPVQEGSQPRAAFDTMLTENGQDPASIGEGDAFTRFDPSSGNEVRFVVTNLTQAGVRFRFAPEAGDHYTLIPGWTNRSVVESANETLVVFRTEPLPMGETFTFYRHWPGASEVVSVNETHAVVRHTPQEGAIRQHEQQTAFRLIVREVREDAIVEAYSDHPLAGRALVADVRLVEILQG